MIWIVTVAIIAFVLYFSAKGNADLKNVDNNTFLKKKYQTLINLIMSRSTSYQFNDKFLNKIILTSTGMTFEIFEINNKLNIVWLWHSFTTNQHYKLGWEFDQNDEQIKMYEMLDKDMTIKSLIDDGITNEEAADIIAIRKAINHSEKERLINEFSIKHPVLSSEMRGK